MSYLYTIGYQGRSLPDLIRELKSNNIRYLVDVRANPVSHRREFCKAKLRHAVEQQGINYLHARDLGSPQELRFRLRSTGDWASFFRSYDGSASLVTSDQGRAA